MRAKYVEFLPVSMLALISLNEQFQKDNLKFFEIMFQQNKNVPIKKVSDFSINGWSCDKNSKYVFSLWSTLKLYRKFEN